MKQKSLVLVHYCKIFLVISNTLWITYNDILMCLICLQLFWPTVARSSCTIYKAFNNHPCQGNNLNLVILKQYTSMELFSVRRYRQNCWTNCPLCTVPIILTIYTTTAYHLGLYKPSFPPAKDLTLIRFTFSYFLTSRLAWPHGTRY